MNGHYDSEISKQWTILGIGKWACAAMVRRLLSFHRQWINVRLAKIRARRTRNIWCGGNCVFILAMSGTALSSPVIPHASQLQLRDPASTPVISLPTNIKGAATMLALLSAVLVTI